MHAVRDRRAVTTPTSPPTPEEEVVHLESLRAQAPDAKRSRVRPTSAELSAAIRQPFSAWAAPKHAGQVVKRGEVVSLLQAFLRPQQQEIERLHQALYRQQERSVAGMLRRLWAWLKRPVAG